MLQRAMSVVAKWLAPAFAAGAPEVLFTLDNFDGIGAFCAKTGSDKVLSKYRCCHLNWGSSHHG
jgi:hypothetical protein